ncbi:MAG: S8 family serine peptidase [Bacteroidales bacterium]|nr:S8 family serine peptidase [Bacteroides sp.]MCM1197945.1 S8 family serine peptidase [Clostridium sp.]MCM1503153.1 S8 family serine peptidase [Bacteroidales bacterium]
MLASVCALAVVTSCEKAGVGGEDVTQSGPMIINESPNAVRGELLIKIRPSQVSTKAAGSASAAGEAMAEISGVLAKNGKFHLERLFPECGRFEERTRAEGLDTWYIANFDRNLETSDVVRQLKACGSIESIEYCLPLMASESEILPVSGTAAPQKASVSRKEQFPFNENAEVQQRQWHYNNSGAIFGKESLVGADANVWSAWKMETGNPDVIVAVIDQGVKYDHEDLAASMWVNSGEIPGNGIDDDGNGYIDDIHGYNFVTDKGQITFSAANSHGTHVAGTIAAVNNNGTGVNGIAGGSGNGDGVRIMTLQTLGSSESGSSGSGLGGAVRAMKYAADNGAVICQNSWGYPDKVSWNTWTRSSFSALRRAIDYFIKYAGVDENGNQSGPMKGGIVIFAAGNEAVNYMTFPAADQKVVSVSAHTYNGGAAMYTNFGTWVSISAPGGDTYLDSEHGGIYSTVVNADGTSGYGYMQGTSMACPHVSGACALAVSYYYGKERRQGLTPDMLRSALLSSAAPINDYLYSAYVGQMGAGMLDTYNMLRYMDYLDGIPAQEIKAGQKVSFDMSLYFPTVQVLSYSVSRQGVVAVQLDKGQMTVEGLSAGNVTVTVSDGRSIFKTIEIKVSK